MRIFSRQSEVASIPTIVDLSEQELAELKKYTQQDDATSSVRLATIEYLRLARRLELKALSGRVEMDEDLKRFSS